ncbi:MAG: glycogen/starch/alpha-glucan family phosphorylase [Acholeplasmatales bacterium]|nr:glycogen/starch/alpha-glucan family phosphorylase [Acholeplasmatales bacterium]
MKSCLETFVDVLYGKSLMEASTKELYNALAKVVVKNVEKNWDETRNLNNKRCGYLSAEFLIGRMIYANLLNAGMLDEAKYILEQNNIDINVFEEVEDAALGNGGLGRLAACYLESAATENILLDGYGLRYRYGLFKQSFKNGFQNEEADDWLKWGDPFSKRVEDDTVIVHFKDMDIKAVPYDMPVIGYHSKVVNTLRLWQSEAIKEFDFKEFDNMEGVKTNDEAYKAKEITYVLYPNDNTLEGKKLRLRQEYFMVSASLQDMLKKFKKLNLTFKELPNYYIWQLNDTHPTLAIPEMIRLLKNEGLSFDESLKIVRKMFNFTNHTIMAEALEQWPIEMLEELIPDVLKEIKLIEEDLEKNLDKNKYFIIKNNKVNMAYLAIYVSEHVNGVAAIHTEILKNNTFKEWYEVYPYKFVNVTNGVTPRRWLALNNESLSKLITSRIGDGWVKNLGELAKLKGIENDEEFLKDFITSRNINKIRLANYIEKHEGIDIPVNYMFDIQIKRLHEYKRQLLNALSILYLAFEIKEGNLIDYKPTVFIFGAKSAPGYYMAKQIIKLINTIADYVNNDSVISKKIKVCFVQNYNVSYAEKLVSAADLSEQISMAGMEASGTGNMKFMINGTPTLGTLDGANVEIAAEAGKSNNYIFGLTVEEVDALKKNYKPELFVENNPKLKKVLNALIDGTLNAKFEEIYDSLLKGNEPDRYLVLADFNSYIEMKLFANKEYQSKEYYKKCIVNMYSSYRFSSDRSIKDYNELIWKL